MLGRKPMERTTPPSRRVRDSPRHVAQHLPISRLHVPNVTSLFGNQATERDTHIGR